jgi:hypothetical protein
MLSKHIAIFIALIAFGLSAALAQQREATTAATAQPPVFQGLMVDAKGKTVGRFIWNANAGTDYVIRQINGTWVSVQVDVVAGFVPQPNAGFHTFFQSTDCTGQAYVGVSLTSGSDGANLPAQGLVAVIPPLTEPTIYFAGAPAAYVNVSSQLDIPGGTCASYSQPGTLYLGPMQSVPASSLGLTPPFRVN